MAGDWHWPTGHRFGGLTQRKHEIHLGRLSLDALLQAFRGQYAGIGQSFQPNVEYALGHPPWTMHNDTTMTLNSSETEFLLIGLEQRHAKMCNSIFHSALNPDLI